MSDKPKTVKEFDEEDRPREKAAKDGCGKLAVADLWAIVLRTGTPGYPITELTRDMMRGIDGRLHNLERRNRKQLMELRGIGLTKAIQIEAVMELIRRYNREGARVRPIIKSPDDIAQLMIPQIGNLDHEEIWILLMNRRNEVVKTTQVSSGGRSSSVFDVKMIIKEALLENASALAMCHNHPSGQLTPSIQDDNITKACMNGCKAVDIQMVDHIIVTDTSYYSYADNGRL